MLGNISHKMNIHASSKKIFLLKLIVQEIKNLITKYIDSTEMLSGKDIPEGSRVTNEMELQFLHQMLSKYEKKLDEAKNDDKLLVNSEVEQLTVQLQELDINR